MGLIQNAQFMEAGMARRATEKLAKQGAEAQATAASTEELLRSLLWEIQQGNKMTWACMTDEQRQIYNTLP